MHGRIDSPELGKEFAHGAGTTPCKGLELNEFGLHGGYSQAPPVVLVHFGLNRRQDGGRERPTCHSPDLEAKSRWGWKPTFGPGHVQDV